MAHLKDHEHPFFKPLWRRVVVVAGCVAWAGVEYLGGSPTWTMIALAFAAYGAWQFFYLYGPDKAEKPQTDGNPLE